MPAVGKSLPVLSAVGIYFRVSPGLADNFMTNALNFIYYIKAIG